MHFWRFACVMCGVSLLWAAEVTKAGNATRLRAGSRPKSVAKPTTGRALWMKYCALCHGARGQGYVADHAPMLSHQGFLASTTEKFLSQAIARGRQGTAMGAYGKQFGGPLSKQQVRAVVVYIKSWQTQPALKARKASPGDAKRGKKRYQAMCAACHGKNGRGKTAPSLGHPDLINSIGDTQLLYAIERGRPGTPMPAYGKSLKAQQIFDIIAYLKKWRRVRKIKRRRAPRLSSSPVIHPRGATPSFGALRKGLYVKAARVKQALAKKQRMILLDARVSSDYLRFHIPGAIPAPYYGIQKLARKLPRHTWIIAYCACPHRASGRVIQTLRKLGYRYTAVLDEGIGYWKDKGYPLVRGAKPFGPKYRATRPKPPRKRPREWSEDLDPFEIF